MKTIADTITTLVELGVTNSAIRAALLKQDFPVEDVEAAMPTAKRTCFINDYFDWLAAEPRDLDEARDYIQNPANSDNVRKYEKMHLNTAELALKIWAAK
jgi:hypothetical protein